MSDRFHGSFYWPSLSPQHQTKIGAIALELVAAWWAQEQATDLTVGGDGLLRAAETAEMELLDALRDAVSDALPPPLFFRASDGGPRVPSCLGQICRVCGCSERDACVPTCSWVAPDLCSTCEGAAA